MNPINPKAQGHTPGKLHVHGEFIRGENGYVIVRMVDGGQQVNALELVRRWNCHEELLEACKALIGHDNPPAGEAGHIDFSQAVAMAKAAIRNAT